MGKLGAKDKVEGQEPKEGSVPMGKLGSKDKGLSLRRDFQEKSDFCQNSKTRDSFYVK